ncbi:MAG: DUF151 domain-containing protein [Spirochaetia bacterium]|nr:DUF151 domain-containing protein [Spirochaetia bacterium]
MLEIKILEVSVTQMGFAIVLQPPGKKKVVPIFIGPLETYSISSAIEGQKNERPMTHDLIKAILISLDFKIKKVFINSFQNGTFYARLYISANLSDKDEIEVDARPSDSIALAIRFGAPIFIDDEVYDKVAVDMDLIKDKKGDVDEAFSDVHENQEEFQHEENMDNELIQTILEEFNESPSLKPYSPARQSKVVADEFKTKKEVLEHMLEAAVKKEDYEEAAKIRDEIKIVGNEASGLLRKQAQTKKDSINKKMD